MHGLPSTTGCSAALTLAGKLPGAQLQAHVTRSVSGLAVPVLRPRPAGLTLQLGDDALAKLQAPMTADITSLADSVVPATACGWPLHVSFREAGNEDRSRIHRRTCAVDSTIAAS